MMHNHALPNLGFIGLGTMGGPMARNLLAAGYPLTAYDLEVTALAAAVSAGAQAAPSLVYLAQQSEVILTSLPSSAVFEQVAESDLLPQAQAGQIFIDLGTTEGQATRRLAQAFAAKGATLIDAPLSGGGAGAQAGNLRIFIGGDATTVEQCRPIFEVLGDPERVVYCGPSGAGQVVKGVNQLAMGLGAAAYLEAIAFGVKGGVDPTAMAQAVGGTEGWRSHFHEIAHRAIAETAEGVVVKFPELPYFLNEANEHAFPAPLTEALFNFLDAGPRDWVDNMNRPTVSFWYQLLQEDRSHKP